MDIRPITATEARTVRLPVLRPGSPPEAAIFDHDDDPGTRHFGAFDGTRLVGVATFFPEPCPVKPGKHAWRLRGMATFPEMRGHGGGSKLVAEGFRVAREGRAELMWCNARVSARGFYEKLGFATLGEEFVLPVAGPHYVMIKDLREPS
jgi:GNAT superfamily N-acetyltransferase